MKKVKKWFTLSQGKNLFGANNLREELIAPISFVEI